VIWANQIIQGVLLGGYYALIACGLSLMFGVMRIINLAHGDFAILGVFAVWLIAAQAGISPFYALFAALPLMALLGWALQHWVFDRTLRAGALVPLLATFGLAIVIENLLFEGFGADTRSLAPDIGDLAFDSWTITGQIYVGHLAVLVFAVAVVLLVGLQLFLKWTVLGRAIRATAEDPDTAELVGINSRAVYAVASAIAVASTAVAGTFLAMRATFDPYSGPAQLIFAFEAVVIGGVGSLWGTLVGGIVLGIAQSVGAQIGPRGFLLTGHVAFLVVLAARLFLSDFDLRGATRRVFGGASGSRLL
jgi:branched-chain amino acid transport system permease protein